jgi:hypothetical protein
MFVLGGCQGQRLAAEGWYKTMLPDSDYTGLISYQKGHYLSMYIV